MLLVVFIALVAVAMGAIGLPGLGPPARTYYVPIVPPIKQDIAADQVFQFENMRKAVEVSFSDKGAKVTGRGVTSQHSHFETGIARRSGFSHGGAHIGDNSAGYWYLNNVDLRNPETFFDLCPPGYELVVPFENQGTQFPLGGRKRRSLEFMDTEWDYAYDTGEFTGRFQMNWCQEIGNSQNGIFAEQQKENGLYFKFTINFGQYDRVCYDDKLVPFDDVSHYLSDLINFNYWSWWNAENGAYPWWADYVYSRNGANDPWWPGFSGNTEDFCRGAPGEYPVAPEFYSFPFPQVLFSIPVEGENVVSHRAVSFATWRDPLLLSDLFPFSWTESNAWRDSYEGTALENAWRSEYYEGYFPSGPYLSQHYNHVGSFWSDNNMLLTVQRFARDTHHDDCEFEQPYYLFNLVSGGQPAASWYVYGYHGINLEDGHDHTFQVTLPVAGTFELSKTSHVPLLYIDGKYICSEPEPVTYKDRLRLWKEPENGWAWVDECEFDNHPDICNNLEYNVRYQLTADPESPISWEDFCSGICGQDYSNYGGWNTEFPNCIDWQSGFMNSMLDMYGGQLPPELLELGDALTSKCNCFADCAIWECWEFSTYGCYYSVRNDFEGILPTLCHNADLQPQTTEDDIYTFVSKDESVSSTCSRTRLYLGNAPNKWVHEGEPSQAVNLYSYAALRGATYKSFSISNYVGIPEPSNHKLCTGNTAQCDKYAFQPWCLAPSKKAEGIYSGLLDVSKLPSSCALKCDTDADCVGENVFCVPTTDSYDHSSPSSTSVDHHLNYANYVAHIPTQNLLNYDDTRSMPQTARDWYTRWWPSIDNHGVPNFPGFTHWWYSERYDGVCEHRSCGANPPCALNQYCYVAPGEASVCKPWAP